MRVARYLGVDKAIAYSVMTRVVGLVTGPLKMVCILGYLSNAEQGFYYTFGSIMALQVFFELGFTTCVTQYAAAEAAHLRYNGREFEGDATHLSRLASLLRFCLKWYSVLAVVVFVAIGGAGFVYFGVFGTEHADVTWRGPWLLLCVSMVVGLLQSPISSFLAGLGYIKEMSRLGFIQNCILPFLFCGMLVGDFGLWVCGVSSLLSQAYFFASIRHARLWQTVTCLLRVRVTERLSYMKEIFPFQWRIALSWVSGYFIFQLANPVLFAECGAEVAGQYGMTLQLLSVIGNFTMAWITTKVPAMSGLIALGKYVELDYLFNTTQRQMVILRVPMYAAFTLAVALLPCLDITFRGSLLQDRLLPLLPTIALVIPNLLQTYIFTWAAYLRCHNKEPYLVNSVVSGVLNMAGTLTFGHLFGLYGVVLSYCSLEVLLFPWGWWIFKTKKREWHGEG